MLEKATQRLYLTTAELHPHTCFLNMKHENIIKMYFPIRLRAS